MDRSKRDRDIRGTPTYRATLAEVLSLRARAIRTIEHQVNDLKVAGNVSEENELLEHIDLCISIAARLNSCATDCIRDPATIDDPEFKRFLIDASLLLSQHEDDVTGK